MEDNNVSNIELDEITTLSMTSSVQGNLSFSENRDELSGGGGSVSSSSGSVAPGSSSSGTTSSSSSSSNLSQSELNDLVPVLLILGDEEPVDDEEPVLLEEDDSIQYTIELNTTLTEIYTINADYKDNIYYTDEEHVIAVLDSNNNIVDNENNDGDIKITAKIDLSWCTVVFIHPLNSPFQLGKYKLSSTNFSYDNNIKVVVPVIHCEANAGNARTANITFLILNLDTNLKMLVNQNAKNEVQLYKYTIYMVIAINTDRVIDVSNNTVNSVINANGIDGVAIVNGQYSSILEATLKYYNNYGQYNKVYNYVVSRLMYAHDIVLTELLIDDNNKLKLFINNLNKFECFTVVGGLANEFETLTYLPADYNKNINDILSITNDERYSDSLSLYQGENYPINTHWEILNSDLTTVSKYNPFDDLGSFIGSADREQSSNAIKKICNITNDDLHLIIYNLTLNTVVKDINWTNWTNNNGEYNII